MGFGWTLDSTSWANGTYAIGVKIVDSTGKESVEVTREFTINNPVPIISVVNPASGYASYGEFIIKVAYLSELGVRYVGIQAENVSGVTRSYQSYDSSSRIPQGFELFDVGNVKSGDFEWKVDTSKWKTGITSIPMIVVDRAYQVVRIQHTIDVKSVKPTLEVTSPSASQAVKGKFTFTIIAKSVTEAKRFVTYVGISDSDAKPKFNANSSYSSRIPYSYSVYNVPTQTSRFEASWTVDFSKSKKGIDEISFAVQDSEGDIFEQKITINVEAAQPIVSILSPAINSTVQGDLRIEVSAAPDPSSSGMVDVIAVNISGGNFDENKLIPEFAGARSYYARNVPSGYIAWDVQDLRKFVFNATAGTLKDGSYRLTVVVLDDSENSVSSSVDFTISTAGPTLKIVSPGTSIVERIPFTLLAETSPNSESRALIGKVGINKQSVTPTFAGNTSFWDGGSVGREFLAWTVNNPRTLSWNIDPTSWPEGDNLVSVVVQDSNGKVSFQSITLHVAPEASFELTIQEIPVLNKTVSVGVTMNVNRSVLRTEIPIKLRAQQARNASGPWSEVPGEIVIDASGRASFRALVVGDMWVRVLHDQLDAVQKGASEPKRIVPQADIRERGETVDASSAKNPDGSVPKVVCTPPNRAKLNESLTIRCTPKDVQDSSQPMALFMNTGSGFKRVASARYPDSFIRTSYTQKGTRATTISFQIRGLSGNDKYVPWSSNSFTIRFTK
jgi:hypothetical protein